MSDDPHFSEIDEYREANPLHEAQLLADLINWEPATEMPERPAGQTVQCAKCHRWFETEAQEFRGRWLFPNLCDPSCGGLMAEEREAKCEPGRIKSFYCPGCGISKNIEPVWGGDQWHYFGQCSHCGARWANATALVRRCQACGKRVAVTSRNPTGRCQCDGQGSNDPF